MDYIDQLQSKSKPKQKHKQIAKCSWCDRKRARNDLCNVCRQKVESRARRLMEQKLEGDMTVVQKVMKYLNDNIPLDQLSNTEIMSLILKCFPFLMLKFQSENTYRGKKGNRCWCLPESVLKKLITSFYDKDKQSTAIIDKGGRQELCDLLMNTVQKHFNTFGINNKQCLKTESNSGKLMVRNLKRNTMDGMGNNNNNMPPRKRSRIDNSNNSNGLDGEIRIWGRSDTELLSFDITKLDAFLHKFENKVLNGVELEQVQPNERVDFLKKRCKEFVKILTELRDYVLHLRDKVRNNNDSDNSIILNAKNREIVQLKNRIDELSNVRNNNREDLMRCTTDLLSKLSSTPVDMNLLRSNMDKLEQYHKLACNELSDAVHCIETIGSKIGYNRSSNTTLKQYTLHLQQNIVNNNNNRNTNTNNNKVKMSYRNNNNNMNVQTQNHFNIRQNNNVNMQTQNNNINVQTQNNNNIISTPITSLNTLNNRLNNRLNNSRQINDIQTIQQQIQQFNANAATSQSNYNRQIINNISNRPSQQQQQQQHIILAPTTYPLQIASNNIQMAANNTSQIPINTTTLQSLQSLDIESVDEFKFGPYFDCNDFCIETESDTTDSLLNQYNVI